MEFSKNEKQKNKKNLFSKIKLNYDRQSIRFKVLATLCFAFVVLILIVLFSTSVMRKTMTVFGNSYQTNESLNQYMHVLTEVESAMESYMQYRTFESIDKYYNYIALLEKKCADLQQKPSSIFLAHKEYIIWKLSNSFIHLSSNALAARRANNLVQMNHYYDKALLCYSFLREEIHSLNLFHFNINAESYKKNKINMSLIFNLMIIIIITVSVFTVYFLYGSFIKIVSPLHEISSVALKVAERDFDVELFKSERKDEIGNICRAFDAMIISIREYIDTIWEKAKKENELREKEIEMRALITESHFKALQEQIQPHFLFNTLNTGAGLATMEGADKTCYFLEQVADFLRYNIQHPGQDATISDELGMLDNYIYIMKVRFGNRYEFEKEIDNELLSVSMPNMILQPLVENCIKHGLKDITENGKIKISVLKDSKKDRITILISDNGCGFDKEKKDLLLKLCNNDDTVIVNSKEINQNEHVSTGLVNVISRLNFYYKRNDIFNIIENAEGSGTTFVLRIPYV